MAKETLDDYLLKENADLVTLTDDVRDFLKKRFTKSLFHEGLVNPDHEINSSGPYLTIYKQTLKEVQGLRELGHPHMLANNLQIEFEENGKRYIFFRMHDSRIVVDTVDNGDRDTRYLWTPTQKAALLKVLEPYIEKRFKTYNEKESEKKGE